MENSRKKAVCPNCGEEIPVVDCVSSFFCLHCGAKLSKEEDHFKIELIDRTVNEAAILREQRLLQEHKERADRQKQEAKIALRILIGFVIVPMLLGYVMVFVVPEVKQAIEKANEPKYTYTYLFAPAENDKAFRGQYYKTVESDLTNYGFKNIQTFGLRDLNSFSDSKNGKVTSVTISGESDWEKHKLFKEDTRKSYSDYSTIIINYHSPK